jgi:multicomponent Na+:H+ antiporter subunit E
VFLTVLFLWLMWSGPLTFDHSLLLWFWIASALLVVWLCDRLGLVTDETVPLELTLRTLAYVPWLALQATFSSVSVLRRAWSPGLDIDPVTARIPSTACTEVGLVSFANSITLTPGTLSLEAVSGNEPSILVHAVAPGGIEELLSGKMDAKIHHVEAPLHSRLSSRAGSGEAG